MPKTHILTKDKYLYPLIDLYSKDTKKEGQIPTQLAIDKQITYAFDHNPTIIRPNDRLVVHRIEFDRSQLDDLAKSLYLIGQRWVCKKKWECSNAHCIIGVNSEGDVRVVVPKTTGTDVEVCIFYEQPYMFDWSMYGALVPSCTGAETRSEMEKLNEQVLEHQNELQEKKRKEEYGTEGVLIFELALQNLGNLKQENAQKDTLATLGFLKEYYSRKLKEIEDEDNELKRKRTQFDHKMIEKDEKIGKSDDEVEEMKQEVSNLRLELKAKDEKLENLKFHNGELNEEVTRLRQKVTSLGQQVKSNNIWVFILQFVFLIIYMYGTLTR